MDSQFPRFHLKVWECARPSIAKRIWEDQQLADPELSHTSACKISFIVVQFHCGAVKPLLLKINQIAGAPDNILA